MKRAGRLRELKVVFRWVQSRPVDRVVDIIQIRPIAAGNRIRDKRCRKSAIGPVKLGLRTVRTKAGQMVRSTGGALTPRLCVQASRPSEIAASDVRIPVIADRGSLNVGGHATSTTTEQREILTTCRPRHLGGPSMGSLGVDSRPGFARRGLRTHGHIANGQASSLGLRHRVRTICPASVRTVRRPGFTGRIALFGHRLPRIRFPAAKRLIASSCEWSGPMWHWPHVCGSRASSMEVEWREWHCVQLPIDPSGLGVPISWHPRHPVSMAAGPSSAASAFGGRSTAPGWYRSPNAIWSADRSVTPRTADQAGNPCRLRANWSYSVRWHA